jgi:hypothetical protein
MAFYAYTGAIFVIGFGIGAYVASHYWAKAINAVAAELAEVPGFESLKK